MMLEVSIKAAMPMEMPLMASQLAYVEKLPFCGENKYRKASRRLKGIIRNFLALEQETGLRP